MPFLSSCSSERCGVHSAIPLEPAVTPADEPLADIFRRQHVVMYVDTLGLGLRIGSAGREARGTSGNGAGEEFAPREPAQAAEAMDYLAADGLGNESG